MSTLNSALLFFDEAVSVVKNLGWYEKDVAWQSSRDPQTFTEHGLLSDIAWVILNSGFRNTTATKLWPSINHSFFYFDSAATILRHRRICVQDALKVLNHPGKIEAMATAAEIVHEEGFDALKSKIIEDPIPTLLRFPFIGKIVVYHLAKNLGFINLAKPDRHLVKIANAFGYQDVQEFCRILSEYCNLPISCVDLILWRYAANTPNYSARLPGRVTNTRSQTPSISCEV